MSRNDLSIGEKKNLLKKFDSLVKCTRRMAVAKLGIAQSSSNKLLIEIESAIVKNKNKNRKRKRCGKDEDIEKTLKKWFIEVRDKNVPVNGALLKTKAEDLAIKLDRKEFKATDGWLTRWLRRENIVFCKLHGEQAEADKKGAENWILTEWPKLLKEFKFSDIYNADVTGLYFRAMPEHTYEFKNQNVKGVKTSKERITLLCCVSMIGKKKTFCYQQVKKTSLLQKRERTACRLR